MGLQMDRLKELRIHNGMTQASLAKRLNISRSSVAMWETGQNEPDSNTLVSLARILNCTVDYLLGIDGARASADNLPDDDDLWTLREEMRRDPERRRLFKLAAHATIEDVKAADALLNALKATNPDFYDGDDPA